MSVFCENSESLYDNANTSDVHPVFRGKKHAHLMADTEEELVEYAASIGLKSSWIQRKGTKLVHFDVVGVYLRKILSDSRVLKLGRKEFVERYKGKMNAI